MRDPALETAGNLANVGLTLTLVSAVASFDQTKEKNLPRFQALNFASARIDTHGGTP